MAEWGSFHLTKQGESLLADAHNQKQLMLTRIVLGSGELAEGQSAGTLTELVKQEQSFPIRSITNNNDGTFTIEARVTNNSLTAGYRVKECGVMAETYSYDDEGNTITTSVLFGTAQATESDFMPAPTGATMVDASMRIVIVIDSDVNVTAKIDYDAYATIKYVDSADEKLQATIDAILSRIYPVGSIYLSVDSTSPESIFGGTWEPIPTGKMLLSAGDGYDVESTGGEAEHTLTVDELPSHSHDMIIKNTDERGRTDEANNSGSGSSGFENFATWHTKTTGGGKAHNNLPPYLAVYMWKRIA
ncbi:phage baseplate protein [Selenomonas sp.]|uniref:phage baseplate protein n=1 Tax=Selenomonas sp. TaxID=2053611 RepID=UPI002A7585ED|nr:hypothetical protein [Selenomonas sp.]MDY3296183.1 hypothetical protein [Selenomonas sp.]